MNENVNREAVASFRGREGRAFTDEQGDFEKIKDYYRNADIAGKHPELFAL